VKTRFEQIYRLHRILRNGRHYSGRELCDRLDCSVSSLKRAVKYMRETLRAPLECGKSDRLYYYEKVDGEQFELPGLWFNADELVALATLVDMLGNLEPGLLREHLDACRARIRALVKGDLDVDQIAEAIRLLPMNRREVAPDVFNTVAAATLRRRKLSFMFRGREGHDPRQRTVSPQRLVRYRDNWYLDALCHESGELRSFGLAWMTQVRPGDDPGHVVPQSRLRDYYASAYGIYNGPADKVARIRFSGPAARYASVEQWHPKQKRKEQPDGVVELHIPYGDPTELVKDVLSWGEFAEIVEPRELRELMAKRLRDAGLRYANEGGVRGG
jgi:predicted DNA-binding transcriptional regulator YafY